jgi:hypothetical protein
VLDRTGGLTLLFSGGHALAAVLVALYNLHQLTFRCFDTTGAFMRDEIVRQAYEAFRIDVERTPSITLRGGNAIDSYDTPPPYDPEVDTITDDYLAAYTFWGIGYLDADSWRHYVAHLIAYTFRHITSLNTMAPEGLLYALRPPDREPPRLATLTLEQEAVIVAFLEQLAFSDDTRLYREDAMQILDEWWLPNALYRPRAERSS